MEDSFYYLSEEKRDSVELTLDDGRVITGKRFGRLESFAGVV